MTIQAPESNSTSFDRQGESSVVSRHQKIWDHLDTIADTEEQWLDGQASYIRSLMVGDDDRLARIGAGIQYVVYALPEGKVFKVARTHMSARNEYDRQGVDENTVEEILRLRDQSARYVQDLVSEHPEISYLFGRPIFNGENGIAAAFEQDRLTVLEGDSFNALSQSEQTDYIHKFITATKSMWTYGCSDRTMNFQVNTGLDNKGKVIIADFGELDITKADTSQTIQDSRWRSAWGVRFLGREMQQVAISMFESELTQDTLGALWAKNLK